MLGVEIFLLLGFSFYFVTETCNASGSGGCPNMDHLLPKEFKIKEFEGTWYEWMRYGQIHGVRCTALSCKVLNETTLRVTFTGSHTKRQVWDEVFVENAITTEEAYLTVNNTLPSKLDVTHKNESKLQTLMGMTTPQFSILGTDYNGYAVLYGCYHLGYIDAHVEFIWIYTRKRMTNSLQTLETEKIWEDLEKFDFYKVVFSYVSQYDCPNVDPSKYYQPKKSK